MVMKAIEMYASLTYGVIDTTRRLCIVVFTGYVLKGENFNMSKCIGVFIVCAGALYYNAAKEKRESNLETAHAGYNARLMPHLAVLF